MKLEDIKKLAKLSSAFEDKCKRVSSIICHARNIEDLVDAGKCNRWRIAIDDDYDGVDMLRVRGCGFDSVCEPVFCEFPAKYLLLSNSELIDIVNNLKTK